MQLWTHNDFSYCARFCISCVATLQGVNTLHENLKY